MEVNKFYNENCLDTMARMPSGFVDLVVTSPPYDNRRSYGLGLCDVWALEYQCSTFALLLNRKQKDE